jgi:hypothetical protein
MRALLFLPLTFIVGIDGFVLFAPVLLGLLALDHVIQGRILRSGADSAGGDFERILQLNLAGNDGDGVVQQIAASTGFDEQLVGGEVVDADADDTYAGGRFDVPGIA